MNHPLIQMEFGIVTILDVNFAIISHPGTGTVCSSRACVWRANNRNQAVQHLISYNRYVFGSFWVYLSDSLNNLGYITLYEKSIRLLNCPAPFLAHEPSIVYHALMINIIEVYILDGLSVNIYLCTEAINSVKHYVMLIHSAISCPAPLHNYHFCISSCTIRFILCVHDTTQLDTKKHACLRL